MQTTCDCAMDSVVLDVVPSCQGSVTRNLQHLSRWGFVSRAPCHSAARDSERLSKRSCPLGAETNPENHGMMLYLDRTTWPESTSAVKGQDFLMKVCPRDGEVHDGER